MDKRAAAKRLQAALLAAAFLAATVAAFMSLKAATDRIVRKKLPGSSIIYVPSGKFLKYATFGYRALAADVIYLWAIQYYATPTIDDRFDHLDHIFAIINELDPRYQDPYEVGALIAVQEARDTRAAFSILDRGATNNPDQWIYPFNAGHVAMMALKDFVLAEKYFEQCMKIPGAPEFVERLRANAIFKKGDLETSWKTWLDIFNKAPDERTKRIASNHLYNVKATMDRNVLEGAAAAYLERFGRLPADLGALVRASLLRDVPKDLDGNDYVYDPATGKVKTVISPWRR